MRFFQLKLFFIACLFQIIYAKSLILANGYNVLLFTPLEFGGNDDIRVIFDVRNVTLNTFRFLPFIVDVTYDSIQNIAYLYLESAVKSYIMLLKWFGGKWCYQIMFEFDSSLYFTQQYHALVVLDNFIYWTADRYIMSGRAPGLEMRRLMQPGWERLFQMTADKEKKILFVASFDFGENNLYSCSVLRYSCIKLLAANFPINSVFFDQTQNELYVASLHLRYLQKFIPNNSSLVDIKMISGPISEMYLANGSIGIFTNRDYIEVWNGGFGLRRARPRLVDPYALRYVFTFKKMNNLDLYPSPFGPIQDILWRDQQFLLYFFILSIDLVESENVFLPQMDLNNNFLLVDSCTDIFYDNKQAILIPSLIGAASVSIILLIAIFICLIRYRLCAKKANSVKSKKNLATPKLTTPKSSFTNSIATSKKPKENFSSGIYIMGKPAIDLRSQSSQSNYYNSIFEQPVKESNQFRNEVKHSVRSNEYLDSLPRVEKNFISAYHVPLTNTQNYINIKKAMDESF
jgi:hypothetical protein